MRGWLCLRELYRTSAAWSLVSPLQHSSQTNEAPAQCWDTTALKDAGFRALMQLAESKQEATECQRLLESLQHAHDELQVSASRPGSFSKFVRPHIPPLYGCLSHGIYIAPEGPISWPATDALRDHSDMFCKCGLIRPALYPAHQNPN